MKSDNEMDDVNCDKDAQTLKDHAALVADPKRHAAAHAKLLEQTQTHQSALDASHKQLRKKVARGLKQAFPANLDKPTPFDEDKKGGGTPFDEAGKGN